MLKGGDSSDYGDMTQRMEAVREIARQTHVHVLVLHHARKGEVTEDSVLGSSAIGGAVDTILMLSRDGEGRRTIRTEKQRYGDEMKATELLLDRETQRVSLGATLEEQACKAVEDRIRDALNGADSLTEKEIKAKVKDHRTSQALRDMVKRGVVKRLGKGGSKDPYRYAITEDLELPLEPEDGTGVEPE